MWQLELFDQLTGHVGRERGMLEEYVAEAARTESKALAYVINLLIADERRHHGQMTDLAMSLMSESELSGEAPVIPRLDFHKADSAELKDLTRRLIANEKDDAAELKRLRGGLDDVADTSLWALLVDTMRLDTEKHLAILRFVESHIRAPGR